MSNLYDEIIGLVFSYLEPTEVFGSCVGVNKLWYGIVYGGNHDYLWRGMCCAILNDEREEFEFMREANMKRKQIEYYYGMIGEGKLCNNWMELFLKLFKPLFALSREYKNKLNYIKNLQYSYVDIVESIHKESCLRIVMTSQQGDHLEIGESKYDGRPDLPKGFSWPINSNGYYFLFTCQLNLKDLQPFHSGKGILPDEGWLYFFIDYEEYNNPDRRVCFYWNGPIEELETVENPPYATAFDITPKMESKRMTFKESIDPFSDEVCRKIFESEISSEVQSFMNREYYCSLQLFGRPQPLQDISELIDNDMIYLMHDSEDGVSAFYFFLNPKTMEISVKMQS